MRPLARGRRQSGGRRRIVMSWRATVSCGVVAGLLVLGVVEVGAQTYIEPPFAGTVTSQQTIEQSTYFSHPWTDPDPTRLEFYMDDGAGGQVKTGPYWPQRFLEAPEEIPLDVQHVKYCPMTTEIDPNLDNNGCWTFEANGELITNCIKRQIVMVNGFLAAVTWETENPQLLDPELLFIDDPNGPVDPELEPPLVVIVTPPSESSEYLPRLAAGEDPCEHHILQSWLNQAIWNTVNLHGVAITIIDPWTAGNRMLHDILSYYVAARLARTLFSLQRRGADHLRPQRLLGRCHVDVGGHPSCPHLRRLQPGRHLRHRRVCQPC